MIAIRPAIAGDVPWLLEQLRAFSTFYGTERPLFPSDDAEARAVLEAQVASHPFFVAIAQGPVGFISGALITHPYNPSIRVLQELFWWVAPDHRGTRAGAKLLSAFIEFGAMHADWILMTLEAKSPVDPRSLERRGFRLHESTFLLEV